VDIYIYLLIFKWLRCNVHAEKPLYYVVDKMVQVIHNPNFQTLSTIYPQPTSRLIHKKLTFQYL
jgi:hypothetical protein